MFMGEYSHTIDTKGRLIIPSKFREELGDEFVLTKGLDGCLSIYPMEQWKIFEKKLEALPLQTKMRGNFHDSLWQVRQHVNWIDRGEFWYRQRYGNLQVWRKMWYSPVI